MNWTKLIVVIIALSGSAVLSGCGTEGLDSQPGARNQGIERSGDEAPGQDETTTTQRGPNFVDENNDGICDHHQNGDRPGCRGRGHGRGHGQGRGQGPGSASEEQ